MSEEAQISLLRSIRMHEALAAAYAADASPANISRCAAQRAIARALRLQAGLEAELPV